MRLDDLRHETALAMTWGNVPPEYAVEVHLGDKVFTIDRVEVENGTFRIYLEGED